MADITTRLETIATKLESNSGKLHDIVNGGSNDSVSVDTGTVLTVSNVLNVIFVRLSRELAAIQVKADAAIADIVADDTHALKDLSNAPNGSIALSNLGLGGYDKAGIHEILADNSDLNDIAKNSVYAFVGEDVRNAPNDIGSGIISTFYNDIRKIFGTQVVYRIQTETGGSTPAQFYRNRTDAGWGSWVEGASGGGSTDGGSTGTSDRLRVVGIPHNEYGYIHGARSVSLIMSDGTIRIGGANTDGALGISESDRFKSIRPLQPAFPKVKSLVKKWIRTRKNSMILMENGSLYVWGNGVSGTLGNGGNIDSRVPIKVALPNSILASNSIKDIAMGNATGDHQQHCIVLVGENVVDGDIDYSGRMYVCGVNDKGQLGLITARGDELNYVWVNDENRTYKAIYAFGSAAGYSYAIAANGDLYGCGWNVSGQLGIGTSLAANHTWTKADLGGKTVKCLISNGASDPFSDGATFNNQSARYTVILTDDGLIYMAGKFVVTDADNKTFTRVSSLADARGIRSLHASAIAFIAITDDGRPYKKGYVNKSFSSDLVEMGSPTVGGDRVSIIDAISTVVAVASNRNADDEEDIYAIGDDGSVYRWNKNLIWDKVFGLKEHKAIKLICPTITSNNINPVIGVLTEEGYYYQIGLDVYKDGVTYDSFQLIN